MKYFIAKVEKRGTVGNVWSVNFKRSVIFFKNLIYPRVSFRGRRKECLNFSPFQNPVLSFIVLQKYYCAKVNH